jgi:hypothetical protein
MTGAGAMTGATCHAAAPPPWATKVALLALGGALAAAILWRLRQRAEPPAAQPAEPAQQAQQQQQQPPPSPLPPKQLERRVFISHTGSDEGAKVFAQSVLKQALDNAGLDTFLDTKNLPPGCDWPGELVDAAAHSAVFVAVLVRRRGARGWGWQAN